MLRRLNEETLGLGPTEFDIMCCLWVHGSLTVRQLHTKINAFRRIAYTTLLTTSARMEEKGLIERHATSEDYNSALLLTPTVTRVQLITHAVQAVCENFNASDDDRAAALAILSNSDA